MLFPPFALPRRAVSVGRPSAKLALRTDEADSGPLGKPHVPLEKELDRGLVAKPSSEPSPEPTNKAPPIPPDMRDEWVAAREGPISCTDRGVSRLRLPSLPHAPISSGSRVEPEKYHVQSSFWETGLPNALYPCAADLVWTLIVSMEALVTHAATGAGQSRKGIV